MFKSMKSAIIVFALAAFAALPVSASDKPDAPLEIAGATTVDADGVIGLLDQHPDLVILDNRKEKDYKGGRIEGAVRLINTEVNAETMAAAVPSKDTPVVMYCNGIKCGRAAKAVQAAIDLGYTKVYYYALGMGEWKEKGLPLVSG